MIDLKIPEENVSPEVIENKEIKSEDESLSEDLLKEIADLSKKLEDANILIKEQNESILRSYAEIENIKRRSNDDISKVRKFGIESFAEGLVPVKDSLEAALLQPNQTIESLIEGVEITLKQLDAVFERNFLKEISPLVGDKFDPNIHQAISSVKSDNQPNTIVQLLQKGYAISDRVLRPALVVVSVGNIDI
ncbi:molecular chaperone GrpE [Candidatus Kinetoplastibacterium blastocrithidii TCC012E]|uniref:Protein GrpE n=1 Tax=Candidatus Kinetoplastidibacterium blastocrithidiae TCC012E TaxID=1208922 RepID=M1LBX3_9PROT|nr:nucleotide exchange factor GrpE [Candidatus Kinetoplastibacterium blastocrithidii]AFZ83828.1 molecular chaperone GrpE [Candidatus Kinetoplastibacterium blastocrithidii (ex Strigomonas culicis)]AGF49953.1 molecular chaperone GrpE [Candidatus Kinetoplastibacterium blastocrithidii TCC012E]